MVATIGLTGLRPNPANVSRIASPPYDVIKPGTPLEKLLADEPSSLFHIILGDEPAAARDRLVSDGALIEDDEPAYYVYEQTWDGGQRTGVFAAAAVSPYEDKQVIRHEKTFDDKVKGRIAMRRATGLHIGPVFVLTRASIGDALERAKQELAVLVKRFESIGKDHESHQPISAQLEKAHEHVDSRSASAATEHIENARQLLDDIDATIQAAKAREGEMDESPDTTDEDEEGAEDTEASGEGEGEREDEEEGEDEASPDEEEAERQP